MKRRRKPYIEQRRPVYVGCEGASEAAYAGLLQDLVREVDLPVHLHIDELGPGAGDPLSRIELAVLRLELLEKRRGRHSKRFAMLDFDQAVQNPQRAEQTCRLADNNGIKILWQRPCFEALLLRHLKGKESSRPPDTRAAIKALEKQWPEYRKPMTRADLARQVNKEAVLRAARVEKDLRLLLDSIGIV